MVPIILIQKEYNGFIPTIALCFLPCHRKSAGMFFSTLATLSIVPNSLLYWMIIHVPFFSCFLKILLASLFLFLPLNTFSLQHFCYNFPSIYNFFISENYKLYCFTFCCFHSVHFQPLSLSALLSVLLHIFVNNLLLEYTSVKVCHVLLMFLHSHCIFSLTFLSISFFCFLYSSFCQFSDSCTFPSKKLVQILW